MNPIVPILILVASKSFDSNDPENQKIILMAFSGIHIAIAAVFGYIFIRMRSSKEQGTVPVPVSEYPPAKEKKLENITFAEYDSRKFRELLVQKLVIPLGIMMFIYNKWAVIMPLLFACVNNPMTIYRAELFQIYVLGKQAKHELARPWADTTAPPAWLQKLTGTGGEADDGSKKKKKK